MNKKITINLNTVSEIKKFINVVSAFESDVDIISEHYVCDAKSIMAVFSYNLTKPVQVEIHSNNENEIEKFVNAMKEFE